MVLPQAIGANFATPMSLGASVREWLWVPKNRGASSQTHRTNAAIFLDIRHFVPIEFVHLIKRTFNQAIEPVNITPLANLCTRGTSSASNNSLNRCSEPKQQVKASRRFVLTFFEYLTVRHHLWTFCRPPPTPINLMVGQIVGHEYALAAVYFADFYCSFRSSRINTRLFVRSTFSY